MKNQFTPLSRKISGYMLVIAMLSFSFIGAECENLLNSLGDQDLSGTWELVSMQGDLQDVCLGESATFNTNTNVATLRCPNASQITRSFTYTGAILTYNDTGVRYNVSFGTLPNSTTQLVLDGANVNRKLSYNRISN